MKSLCLFVCLLIVRECAAVGGLILTLPLEAEAGSLGSAALLLCCTTGWLAHELLGNCSASAFCLSLGVLGLQMCFISSGFLCGSEHQTQVLSYQAISQVLAVFLKIRLSARKTTGDMLPLSRGVYNSYYLLHWE